MHISMSLGNAFSSKTDDSTRAMCHVRHNSMYRWSTPSVGKMDYNYTLQHNFPTTSLSHAHCRLKLAACNLYADNKLRKLYRYRELMKYVCDSELLFVI